MDSGVMYGMFWAGLLLSAFPLAVGIAGMVFLARRYREERSAGAEIEPATEGRQG